MPWTYHCIPFVTAITGLIIGDYLVSPLGPLANTIFPPLSLIIGGYAGLVILGEISDRRTD